MSNRKIKTSTKQKENNQAKGSILQKFLWWCAGADISILRICPKVQNNYTIHGVFVVVDTILAWIAGYKVMKIAADTPGGSIIFATVLSIVIFWLYRFTLVSLRSDGKISISRDEIHSNIIPIIVSIVFGIAIAIPFELIIYSQDILLQGVQPTSDLNEHIAALTYIAMGDYQSWFSSWGSFGHILDLILHWWWTYLFTTAQGWITFLIIIINLCPIILKMRSADSDYVRLLHQKKQNT